MGEPPPILKHPLSHPQVHVGTQLCGTNREATGDDMSPSCSAKPSIDLVPPEVEILLRVGKPAGVTGAANTIDRAHVAEKVVTADFMGSVVVAATDLFSMLVTVLYLGNSWRVLIFFHGAVALGDSDCEARYLELLTMRVKCPG